MVNMLLHFKLPSISNVFRFVILFSFSVITKFRLSAKDVHL